VSWSSRSTSASSPTALIAGVTPRDIVTGVAAQVEPLSPVGIRVTELRPEQAAILVRLIEVYLGRMAEPLAEQRRAALETRISAR
jgi:hypothetical protein